MADGSRPTIQNGYNELFFFKNRDPRFYRTFAFSDCKWPQKTTPANNSATSTVWAYNWVEVKTTGTRKNTIYHFSNNR